MGVRLNSGWLMNTRRHWRRRVSDDELAIELWTHLGVLGTREVDLVECHAVHELFRRDLGSETSDVSENVNGERQVRGPRVASHFQCLNVTFSQQRLKRLKHKYSQGIRSIAMILLGIWRDDSAVRIPLLMRSTIFGVSLPTGFTNKMLCN